MPECGFNLRVGLIQKTPDQWVNVFNLSPWQFRRRHCHAGALSQAGHLRLRQLASPVRISVSPPINFHYCFQPPPELVWVRTVQPMRSHMCGACSMVQMTAIPGTTGTPRLLQPVRLPISATPCSILCMFPLSDFICTAGLGIARPENEGVRAAVGRWGPACTMRRTTVHTTDAPCGPSLLSVDIARRSPDARLWPFRIGFLIAIQDRRVQWICQFILINSSPNPTN